MFTTMIGADADELERAAGALRSAADDLNGHADGVTAVLSSVAWVGGVATRFGSNWSGSLRPRIASSVSFARQAATELDRHAAEQRRASQAHAASPGLATVGGSSGAYGVSSAPGHARGGGRFDQLLDGLSLGHEQTEILAGLGSRLSERGDVGKLIDVLTDDAFATFLVGAEHVLDAGSVVVDAVTDFAEHVHLQFDERIVHSLADTAVRLGFDQGMEFAAEWMAGAATVALLPGFGGVLAPLVAEIAGVVADEVAGAAVAAIDGATDLVDVIADAAVVAYRQVKEVFGLVADLTVAAVGVVDDAFDLAGYAGGAVLDAGGSILRSGIGSAAGALESLNPFGNG